MRIPFVTALLVLAAAPHVAPAQAVLEQASTQPRITVTMSRSARVVADRAVVYLTVEGSGETAADAAARGEKKMQAILDALRPLNVRVEGPVPYGTSPVAVMNTYPGMPQPPQVVTRSVLRVPITRLSQAAAVASAGLAAGATSAPVLNFESSATDSVRRSLYGEAVAAAQAEAEALARAMNVSIGRATDASANFNPASFSSPYFNLFTRGYDGGSQAAPEIAIVSSITMRFPIVPKP